MEQRAEHLTLGSKAKLSGDTCGSMLPSTAATLETCYLPLPKDKEMASIPAPLQG